ncbi:MAG TPA: UMP kinase [Bacteroidales bacterium]|nr:UMP kinase [Bacteroidales bacterium]HRZ48864.1 UMP kinase [Bacteroidales bacterium]
MKYRKILLKLSGESLMGEQGYGIDPIRLEYYADEIATAVQAGCETGIVIGGGNIFRGLQGASEIMDRVQGDYMGMLATLINSVALRSALESRSIPTLLLSGLPVDGIAAKATRPAAMEAFKAGKVVIFAGGTGNPFFTTDTAAALRAAEAHAEVLLKGTRVDGVYTDDPEKNPAAIKLTRITFNDAIQKGYKILDITAFTMCRENHIPIIVFDIQKPGNLLKELLGEQTGTLVSD